MSETLFCSYVETFENDLQMGARYGIINKIDKKGCVNMENKYQVNNILTNKNTGEVTKIYAVTKDRQPFDLLDVSILKHFNVLTMDGLRDKMVAHGIEGNLVEKGFSISLTLATQEDAEKFIEKIAPLYNEVLQ